LLYIPDDKEEWIFYTNLIEHTDYIDLNQYSFSRNLETNAQPLVDIQTLVRLSLKAQKKYNIPLAEYAFLTKLKLQYDKFVYNIMYALATPQGVRNYQLTRKVLFISMIIFYLLFLLFIIKHFIMLK